MSFSPSCFHKTLLLGKYMSETNGLHYNKTNGTFWNVVSATIYCVIMYLLINATSKPISDHFTLAETVDYK